VLGVKFGSSKKPKIPTALPLNNSAETQTLQEVENALFYQLHERLQFVAKPNAIVADLLFDLGNIVSLDNRGAGAAIGVYQLALQYAPVQRDIVEKRRDFAEHALGTSSPWLYWTILGGVATCIFSSGLYFTWRERGERLAHG
jgi:hypothetical protein